jgi:hypothetical protein
MKLNQRSGRLVDTMAVLQDLLSGAFLITYSRYSDKKYCT